MFTFGICLSIWRRPGLTFARCRTLSSALHRFDLGKYVVFGFIKIFPKISEAPKISKVFNIEEVELLDRAKL